MFEVSTKVLVVDDDMVTLKLLQEALESYGFKCLLANNFNTARKIFFEEKSIDLVITDVRLPDFSGIELFKVFRKEKPDQPIIMMSGSAEIELPSTIDAFIQKPVSKKEIILASRKIFRDRKKQLPLKEHKSYEFNPFKEMDQIVKRLEDRKNQIGNVKIDLISYGDIVLLITPIDIEAPEGRLILPQVQAIRDILDNDAVCIVLKEKEVDAFLRKTGIKPKLVVTDSQVFLKAGASIPSDIALTSFSIMLAHFKGNFSAYLKGTPKISELKEGDKVLLLESCTHHSSCDDIGRVKIPRWISNFTGKQLEYVVVAGLDEVPGNITDYSLLIQCGGCMITPKQLGNRLQPAIDAGIPVTNYGMAIAYVQGIYTRAVAPFAKIEDSTSDYL